MMKSFRKLSAEEQIQADQKKAKLKEFIEAVSQMSEDELIQLKEHISIITCEGHDLSLKNNALLDFQAKGAGMIISVVGGFQQWLNNGRAVRKGERAFTILAPSQGKAKDKDGNELDKTYFKCVSVFDLSQTDVISEESEVKEVELVAV